MNTPANIKIVIKKYTINFLINFLVFIKNLLKILKILIKKSLKTIINISIIKSVLIDNNKSNLLTVILIMCFK